LLAVAVVGSLAACAQPEPEVPKTVIVFELSGTRAENVQYGENESREIASVALPWKVTKEVPQGFIAPYLAAENGGAGELTCRIWVDGVLAKAMTASGEHASVSCESVQTT
jgi:hypothetical protein